MKEGDPSTRVLIVPAGAPRPPPPPERVGIDAWLPRRKPASAPVEPPSDQGGAAPPAEEAVDSEVPRVLRQIHACFPKPIWSQEWRAAVDQQWTLGRQGLFKADKDLILFGEYLGWAKYCVHLERERKRLRT